MSGYVITSLVMATALAGLLPAALRFPRVGWLAWIYAFSFAILWGVSASLQPTDCMIERDVLLSISLLFPVAVAFLMWKFTRRAPTAEQHPVVWFMAAYGGYLAVWVGSIMFYNAYLNQGCA